MDGDYKNLELKDIIESLFRRLKEKGVTVYQISHKTKIPESTINSWRKSHRKSGPTLANFINVCRAATVSIDEIVGIGSHLRPGIDNYLERQIRKLRALDEKDFKLINDMIDRLYEAELGDKEPPRTKRRRLKLVAEDQKKTEGSDYTVPKDSGIS